MKKLFIKAFKLTIPIFAGYIVLGIAFGVMLANLGYNPIYTTIMSIFIYAGSGQFVAVSLLANHIDLINVFIISFVINFRHIFYGISLLKTYSGLGKLKPYAIFATTDETFSVLISQEFEEKEKKPLILLICLLDHLYWILGSTIGGFLYQFINFSTKGIDFVLTALFVVIMIDQIKKIKNKYLPFIGIITTTICLLIFKDNFIIPSLTIILIIVTILKKPFTTIEEGPINAN